MVPWWSLLIVVGVLSIWFAAPLFADALHKAQRDHYRKRAAEHWSERYREEVEALAHSVRSNGIRYEIRITPWNPEEWRWAIFDADAALAVWTSELDPQPATAPRPGVHIPFIDGWGRTRAEAEAKALYWIQQRTDPDLPAPVVIPSVPDTSTWP